jgi:imidazolonepropionase-like amidohydrolase
MITQTSRWIILVTLLAPGVLSAQQSGSTVIRAGNVFDSEAGTLLGPKNIVVNGNRIVAIRDAADVPAADEVIDLRAYTVIPGLIDTHTHLLYLEAIGSGLTMEGIKAVVTEGTVLRALHGAARARTFLDAGITTVRDLGNSGQFGDVALSRAIADGSHAGPRVIPSGPGLSPEGGQFPGLQPEFRSVADTEYRIVRGPEDAAAAVQENVAFGARVIKIFANNTPNPGSLSIAEMEAIVETAHRLGVKVSAHATSDAAIWRAVEAGVDAIDHGYQVADSTLSLMAEQGTFLVPTDVDSLGLLKFFEGQDNPASPAQVSGQLQFLRDRLRRARAAGVTIAAGSDMYIDMNRPQGEAAKRVLFAYAEAGMPSLEILQAATINAAVLLGMEGRLGVVKAGAFADIVAVDGNPLGDLGALERVVFVMKNGQTYMRHR